jgi:hypothetical protein
MICLAIIANTITPPTMYKVFTGNPSTVLSIFLGLNLFKVKLISSFNPLFKGNTPFVFSLVNHSEKLSVPPSSLYFLKS